MEKLTFYYSAMSGGKSSILIQTAYNYTNVGKKILVIKPGKDTKGDSFITSRVGSSLKVDVLLGAKESLLSNKYLNDLIGCDCIFVDEAQFLSGNQVEDLWRIKKEMDIPVVCFGIKTNFRSQLFTGSKRLIELADHVAELHTMPLCSCGEKARFNARLVNGEYVFDGDVIVVDGSSDSVVYESLCGKCYLKKVFRKK